MPTDSAFPPLLSAQADIDRACAAMADAPRISFDTEFVRTRTYAPRLGLLQVGVGTHCLCIDPLGTAQLEDFWAQLFDGARAIILHAGKQDMELLWFERGRVLSNLVDTQACAALLGYPAQIGYAGLVQEVLGIAVSKEQTRTDWTRRPLSEAQLAYAAADVEHLALLHDRLQSRLEPLGRYAWALEDSAALSDPALYRPAPETAWQRIRSVPYLPGPQQARLRALAAWRETLAVEVDKPRQWILDDAGLLELAADNPPDTQALGQLAKVPPAVARKQGKSILAALEHGNAQYAAQPEAFSQSEPDSEADKTRMKQLMRRVRSVAEELGIAPEVLASKRDLNTLLRDPEHCRVLSGWRLEVIGRELQAAL